MLVIPAFFTALPLLCFAVKAHHESPLPPAERSISNRDIKPFATIDFGNTTGKAQNNYASGILFGIPEWNGQDQIPGHFFSDIGFNWYRGGGAQLPEPSRGWIWGLNEYKGRWKNTVSEYNTVTKNGGKFILVLPALYGDVDPKSSPYPGDNNNWTSYDKFIDQVIKDMKNSHVNLDKFVVDIQNETDGPWYWTRGQGRSFEVWRRAYTKFKRAFGPKVKIQGPSYSGKPRLDNDWWTGFASFVKKNNCPPDTWTWHMEEGDGNMLESTDQLDRILDQAGLPPTTDININEYATFDEQVPSGAAWWISQLERVNAPGVRGNWLNGDQLLDFLASLLSKPGAPDQYDRNANDYFPNGEYQVYKYYAKSMTGSRVGTLPTDDGLLDIYVTKDEDAKKVRILIGTRRKTGSWDIHLSSLSSLGLADAGKLDVACLAFPNEGHWGRVDGPTDCPSFSVDYKDGSASITFESDNEEVAYAWEFEF
ncbi:hypothetical protein ACHAPJ_007988 [Fusarium lateritium]